MRGEFELIATYFAPLARDAAGAENLTNDAAVFAPTAGRDLVVTVDAMVAGVHFLPDDPGDLVGRKLLRVNLSDLAAMGAAPRAYVLTVALPRDTEEDWIATLAAGLEADQAAFGIVLLGGDTVSTPGPLTLSLTAFGEVVPGTALARSTARAGDLVYVSGTIGDGALGLKVLQGDLAGLSEAARDALADRYRLPRPRLALGQTLADHRLATAALDVSDGLVADLGHIAGASGLGAEIEAEAVPVSPAVSAAVTADPELRAAVFGGGDDYELLFTVAPENAVGMADLAAGLDLPLTCIGRMCADRGVRVVDRQGQEVPVPEEGWAHF